MSTLWTYGCSWTYSKNHEEIGLIFWPTFVAKELNLELINRAEGGLGDSSIKKLLFDLLKIKKDDLVIFEFSYNTRLDLPKFNNKNGIWNHSIFDMYEIFETNDKEKKMIYMDFVMEFDAELLLKNFEYVSLIFDYLERVIGATVKYWFLDLNFPSENKKFITDRISKDRQRNVFFSINDIYSANVIINENRLRFSDYEYEDSNLDWLKYDGHPNQEGQQKIAECVLDSLKKNKYLI